MLGQPFILLAFALFISLTEAFHTSLKPSRFITRSLNAVPLEIKDKVDPNKKWSVKFILNGVEKEAVVSETTSLLEAAEKLYKNAPYSCRNGVCTTCAAKIVGGRESVLLAVHGLGEPITKLDYVCSCQSFPIGPNIIIQLGAYDDVYELQYGQYEKSYEKTALTGKWDEKSKKYL